GHERGSSHGTSRIIRSAYPSSAYVHLMRAVTREEWPRLESLAGTQLVFPAPACFFGRGALFEAYADTMRAFPNEVEILSGAEAAPLFPSLRLDGVDAIVDRTGGVLAARRTMDTLRRLCDEAGVEVRENAPVRAWSSEPEGIRVEYEGGEVLARHVMVAAGAWIGELLPFLKSRVFVARQTIGYFRLDGPMSVERFPVWCYLGDAANDFYYGLPEFDRDGVKLARHYTANRSDDPNQAATPDPNAVDDLYRFAARRFTAPVLEMAGAENCLYTCTPTEDFIIDRHPDDGRVVFASACSGHGFKFGPLTGRILAELVLLGKTSVPEFEAYRGTFALT
ncbi:MAG TPA: FAD-dependent oxidoreductase, partial [Dongiaceae bacterium]|nr:FAD-dependent oxidoreductase [Dongiaceae bacterium]